MDNKTTPASIPKRPWVRPALTVLARSSSEEQVLASCKGSYAVIGDGPFGITCEQMNTLFCNQTNAS